MSRPFSWYPLAPSDPVPGDPAAVQTAGVRYTHMAVTITATARQLRTLTDADGTVSDAVDAIREKAETVAGDIERAHDRYHGVGLALQTYATALAAAQTEADAALADARAAQERLDQANAAITLAQRRLDGLSDEDVDDEARTRYQGQRTSARNERDDAEIALIAARTRLDAAVADRDSAAEIAIGAIDDIPSDGLDDGWWEDWGSDIAHTVSTWAGNLAAGFGIAALVLSWVPVVGPALGIIAAGLGAVALVADLFIAFNEGGAEAWTNVALGVVGLVTFGAGQAIGRSARALSTTASSAMAQAAQQGSRSLFSRITSFVLRRPPMPATTALPQLGGTFARGSSWASRTAAAWREIRSLRGMDAVLALAGHGELVGTNNALRAAFGQAFPWHPRACLTLLGPLVRGTALEGAALVQYTGDLTLTSTSLAKVGTDAPTPEREPAEVLSL